MLKAIQSIVDVAKNAALVAFLIWLFYYGRPALKTFFDQVAGGTRVVKTVKYGRESIEVDLEDAKDKLSAAVNSQAKSEGKKDEPVPPEIKAAASALQQTDAALAALSNRQAKPVPATSPEKNPAIWVYLGIEKNGTWQPNYFGLQGAPRVGMTITANTDVFERDSSPVYIDNIKDWKLGSVIGVLQRGTTASIKELEHIESDNGGVNWWARIK